MALVNPSPAPAAPAPQSGQSARQAQPPAMAGPAPAAGAPCPGGGTRGPGGKCVQMTAMSGGGGGGGPQAAATPPQPAMSSSVLPGEGNIPGASTQPVHTAGGYSLQQGGAPTAPQGGAPQQAGANSAGVNADNVADYAMKNIDSSISKQEWDSYKQYFDPSCPPGTPYKSRKIDTKGNPVQGCMEKPDNCPDGQTAYGEHQCVPVNDPRVAWSTGAGGAGGGGAGGGGAMGGGGWGMSAQEKAFMSSLTQLANQMRTQGAQLFKTGSQDYRLASDKFRSMAGVYGRSGVQEATAPEAGAISDAYKGAEASLVGLRGAELAQAKADLARGKAGDIGGLAAKEAGQAVAALEGSGQFGIQAGQQGIGQAASTYAGAQGAAMQSRLTEEGYQNQWNIASLQANVSEDQIAAQKEMAYAQLQQSADQWSQRLALDTNMFQEQMREFNIGQQNQKSASKSSFWGGLLGTGVSAAAVLL